MVLYGENPDRAQESSGAILLMEYLERAGELIAFGLQPKLLPARDPSYEKLVALYRTDLQFQRVTDRICKGLGLKVVYADRSGFYLGAGEDSPFVYSVADLKRERAMTDVSGTKRGLYGLIAVGIAAYFYPHARYLVDPSHRPATAQAVDGTIRSACKELADRYGSADPTREDEPAWQTYLREKETSQGDDGRTGQRGTILEVRRMLDVFAEQGLVKKSDRGRNLTEYQPMERFRQQIVHFAGDALFETFSRARMRDLSEVS